MHPNNIYKIFGNNFEFPIRMINGSVKVIKDITIDMAKKTIGMLACPSYSKNKIFSEIVKINNIGDTVIAFLKDGRILNIEILIFKEKENICE